MFLNTIIFLILCNKIILCSLLTNRCSPEYCNFAGDCRVVNNKPNCSCYAETFHGKYCEKVKNLCLTNENRCTRDQVCIPYVSQTICKCKQRSSGNSCNGATKPLLSYNFRALYGVREFIVLSFENFDTADIEITVSTPSYMIGHVSRNSAVTSKHTKNLTATLQSLGIRRHMRIPYDEAQYYVFQAKYFTMGANQLTTITKSFNSKDEWQPRQVQNLSLIVYVASPRASLCIPKIILQHTDPQNPKQVFVERFTNIQAILENRCSPSNTQYHISWTISSFDDRIVFYHSEVNQNLLLKIPRYKLWYTNLVKQYPNLLLSVRISFREETGAWIMERCYINVTAHHVEARIAGGSFRTVGAHQPALLDGSKSREPGRNPYVNQHLTYKWTLSDIDGRNTEVLSNESSNSVISLPSKKLKIDATMLVSLIVSNKFTKVRTHTTTQIIKVVSDNNPLQIDIQCVKNCAFNIYNPNEILHLRAICKDCETELRYLWTVNSVDMKQNKQRFVMKLDNKQPNVITIEVTVSHKERRGVARLEFQKAAIPTGGHCKIEPQDGVECLTDFHIKCSGYKSINQHPIYYKFNLGLLTEDFNYSGETTVRLNGNDSLTIVICGPHLYCNRKELEFKIIPISKIPTLTSMAQMLQMGKRQEAFCLEQMIMSNYQLLNTLNFYEAIGNDIQPTLLEVTNSFVVLQKLTFKIYPLYSFKWFVLRHVFNRITNGIQYIRNDTEIWDMEESTVLYLIQILTRMVSIVLRGKHSNLRQELITGMDEDPFSENYLKLNRLDPTVAFRVFRYAQTLQTINLLSELLGHIATRFIVPEQPFNYNTNETSCRFEMHDEIAPINYTSNCTNCLMTVPLKTVLDLRQRYNTSQIMLQTWCFAYDVLWWAPERWHPSTATFAVHFLFGNYGNQPTIGSQFDYHISLRHTKDSVRTPFVEKGEIHYHIVIYKVNLAAFVNLVINFIETESRLQVVVTMNKKPTLNELKASNCFVPKGRSNTTFILKNHCNGSYDAYIGINKANSFDTSRSLYIFSLSAMECSVWGRHKMAEKWIRNGCSAENLEQNPEYAKCRFRHLSTFSAREFAIKPIPLHKRYDDENIHINLFSLFFNVFVFVGGILLIWLTSRRSKNRNHNLIRVIKSDRDAEPAHMENIIVHLRTGGMLLALTTANIKLVFISDLGRYKVIIYQNPNNPNLKINTSCMLRLSEMRLKLPCRLTISHDVSGRYSSWFCRTIQIDDLPQDISYTFQIHCWIKRNQKVRVSCYPHEMSNPTKYRLYKLYTPTDRYHRFLIRFRYYCKFYYINWFWMQPVMGPWRYNDYSWNISERTSIWVSKTILTLAIVFCYYGKASNIDYERITASEFLAIAIGSYLATIVLDILFLNLSRG